MQTAKTPQRESTATCPALMLAFELGEFGWTLGFTTSPAQRARRRQVPAGDIGRVLAEIATAKRRFYLPEDASVTSCYEAGREGFWLHRCLEAHGVRNLVVDSSSIEVKRRARRTKTDRLDLDGLLRLLARYLGGERHAWSVVHVPSAAAEDARQLDRELETVIQDRTRVSIKVDRVRRRERHLEAHHVWTLDYEVGRFFRAAAQVALTMLLLWIIYLALEPYLRRFWPHSLLGWSRLFAGRLRDARVGRDAMC
jgi:hypothetical protein